MPCDNKMLNDMLKSVFAVCMGVLWCVVNHVNQAALTPLFSLVSYLHSSIVARAQRGMVPGEDLAELTWGCVAPESPNPPGGTSC